MGLTAGQLDQTPDAALVALAQAGESAAFGALIRRHQGWLRGLLRRLCGDETLADDLAQEAFMQAWRKIKSLREPGAFAGWLKRLAVNSWLQHARKNDALADAEELVHEDAATPPSGLAIDLQAALAALPPPMRVCIVLTYHEGHSHSEIANLTGLPLGTVKSHIKRGSAELQARLSEYQEHST